MKDLHLQILRHALGMDGRDPGWRNYYVMPRDNPTLVEMENAGLVTWTPIPWTCSGGTWRATELGKSAVGLSEDSGCGGAS